MSRKREAGMPSTALYKMAGNGWKLFRGFLLFGLGFVLLYPILYTVVMAFRPPEDIYDPTVIWISNSLTMENLNLAMELMDYGNTVKNTLFVNIGSSILQVLTCSTAGYAFARFHFKGKGLLFGVVLFTIIVPPQIISTPSYVNFQFFDFFGVGALVKVLSGVDISVSLIDTVWAFYLPALLGAGIKAGLFVFLFRQFYRGLPVELEDAAAIDGCGFLACYVRIMVPNSVSVIITSLILSAAWYWNDYYTSALYINAMNTVTPSLMNLETASKMVFGMDQSDPYKIITLMQAGCLLTILPLILAYVVLQRFLVKGFANSGIVG